MTIVRTRVKVARSMRWAASFAILLCTAVAGARSPASGAADETTVELEVAHAELWVELAADARRIAAEIGGPPDGEEDRARAFQTVLAAERGGRRTFLLFDPFGDVEVWGGPGLLHTISVQAARSRPCGFAESAASVTLWCAVPLGRTTADREAGAWTLVAGESFGKEGEPPVATPARGKFRVFSWQLVEQTDGPPHLVVDGLVEPRRELDGTAVARAAAALAALLLATWLLAASRPERGSLLGPALGLGAFAAGATPWAAFASGSAAFAAVVAFRLRDSAASRWRVAAGRAAAAAVGPLLVLGPLWMEEGLGLGEAQALFGSPTLAASRLAATLLVLAALWLGGRTKNAAGVGSARWMTFSLAAAISAALVESSWLAALLLGLAGVAAAFGSDRLGERRAIALIATFVAAALIAAAAATTADAVLDRRRAPKLVASLLPPSNDAMEARIDELDRQIEAAAALTLQQTPPVSLPPADLAYAIWRRSPLARRDARSALAVGRAGFPPSLFAFGLPVDEMGRLDPAPVRWVELEPEPWRTRAIAGELDVEGAEGARWRLRWTLVPRPGFGDPAPELGDLASGLLRGGAARERLLALPAGMRVALYEAGGELLVSPWTEGTPAFDPEWLTPRGPEIRLETPDGPARVVTASGEGVTAVLFAPAGRWSEALEKVGSFAAGTLLVVAGLVGAGLLVAHRPAGAAAALRRLMRSYSQRLLLVFSALVLVPTVLLYALLASALERRLEREQESRAREALRSAQRVLGEYVLSLDPGFGIDTALDDRLLEWLARVVRHEVNLYWGSELYASSKRELFTSGLAPGRIPGEIWQRIAVEGDPFARRTASAGRHDYLELYAPLEVPGEGRRQSQLVLALPLLAQQEDLAAEIARVRRRVLLGTLALFGLLAASGVALARSFARPIQELVDGTRRIADGAAELGFRPGELELESLAEAIDRMAAKIAEGRSKLVAEKSLVERIVENVTAAVVGLDREGRVLLANRFARERLAATPGENLRTNLGLAGLERLAAAFDSARPGVEAVATEASGPAGRAWTLVRVPLGGGEPAELVVIEDVTEVSHAQRLEAWAAMARIIAHEIKNPLTPIRLSTEHLREAWARDREHFEAVFERCTSNILAQVEELRRTASEFSLYSEIPRSEKRSGELGEIVAEVVDGYRTAPPPGVTIRYRGPSRPLAAELDRRLVGRAVRNLIENALRAQATGGEIDVEVGGEDGSGFVRVADRGPGVAPELLGRILEPYFSTQAGGTGLGLPIARRVAAEHGGELTVRNRAGGGFEVTMTIPLR